MAEAHALGQDAVLEGVFSCHVRCVEVLLVAEYFVSLDEDRDRIGCSMTPLNPVAHPWLLVNNMT